MSSSSSSSSLQVMLQQSLTEVTQKVVASLQTRIDEHRTTHLSSNNTTTTTTSVGLDFLDTKNGLLLSYLIELTYHLRNHLQLLQQQQQQQQQQPQSAPSSSSATELQLLVQQQQQQQQLCWHRWRVLKTSLDKLRGLDKKLRYQIDKLLAHASAANPNGSSSSAQFATATQQDVVVEEDPLQFRPGRLEDDNDKNEEDEDDESSSGTHSADTNDTDASDVDDDLAAAQRTIAMARVVQRSTTTAKKGGNNNNDKNDDNQDDNHTTIYRAPRLAAVPYGHDDDHEPRGIATRERRQRQKLRASEVAETLRLQYGAAPEQDDTHGGGAGIGRQREATRRLEERERERTAFEEDNMIRLAVPRAEKKERKRWMREEMSNLSAIADLGNLARDSNLRRQHKTTSSSQGGGGDGSNAQGGEDEQRYMNGKRRRQVTDRDGRATGKGEHRPKAQNALQNAMFGANDSGKNKKRKSKR